MTPLIDHEKVTHTGNLCKLPPKLLLAGSFGANFISCCFGRGPISLSVKERIEMDISTFASCQEQFSNGTDIVVLECVAKSLERSQNEAEESLRNFLFVLSGGMIFFMQAGFAILCAGAVRIKNVQNTMLKNLLDACGAAISFYAFGK